MFYMTVIENAQRPSSLESIFFKPGHNLDTNKAPVIPEELDQRVCTHVYIYAAVLTKRLFELQSSFLFHYKARQRFQGPLVYTRLMIIINYTH